MAGELQRCIDAIHLPWFHFSGLSAVFLGEEITQTQVWIKKCT